MALLAMYFSLQGATMGHTLETWKDARGRSPGMVTRIEETVMAVEQHWYGNDMELEVRMGLAMACIAVMYAGVFWLCAAVLHISPLAAALLLGTGFVLQYRYGYQLMLSGLGVRFVPRERVPGVVEALERLSQGAGVPVPQVGLLRSALPNAFSAGRGPNRAVIVVTTALLESVSGEELIAVLAHEVAHIRNRDMVAMTFAGVLPALFTSFAGACRGEEPARAGHTRSILATCAQALATVTSVPLWTLSRYREYAADRGAALLTGSPETVAAAILRISSELEGIPRSDLRELGPLGAFCFTAPRRRETHVLSPDPYPEERLAWRLASAVDGFVTGHPPVRARIAWLGRLQRAMTHV